jgi:hypothetical protein|tara:strand:- start:850 stop:1074 length:225 start_codon:yes stop_codon:yes gene_type:complete
MTEDLRQKEIALRKELAKVKAQNANADRRITPNRDFSMGAAPDTTHKSIPTSTDIPDVISLPPRRRGKKENIPF